MKKRIFLLTFGLLAVLLAGYAAAAGGDSSDPLISLSFLTGKFQSQAEEKIDEAIGKANTNTLADAKAQWSAAVARAEANAGAEYVDLMTEAMLKRSDILSGTTGLQVISRAGTVAASFSSGAVIDVTDGREIASGATLTVNHRYLVAEDTTALFTVSSKTAVIDYCGFYHFSLSDRPDYNAMADALRSLSLFRGSDTAYGSGYDLQRVPTRMEALVMLIRMLGEEDAALRCTASHPFVDVPDWGVPYVAYAYEKGYSNGVGRDRYGRELFGAQMDASAEMYTEFVLRALGHSSTAVSDISDSPDRAERCGVITGGECAALKNGGFLRADAVYLSYYALGAQTADGTLLANRLSAAGVFSAADYSAAQKTVTTERIA